MPGFYSEMDCLINTSTYKETCGLPIMEAAAAGRLVISANIGIVDHLHKSPGIIVPEDEDNFIKASSCVINYYKSDDVLCNHCKKEIAENTMIGLLLLMTGLM